MAHLFSSGEILYKKNQKELPEGLLIGTALEYKQVEPATRYSCGGTIGNKQVKVFFTLLKEEFDSIKNRHAFGILMPSDVLMADWENYEIQWLG